jgi:hypothetical protein
MKEMRFKGFVKGSYEFHGDFTEGKVYEVLDESKGDPHDAKFMDDTGAHMWEYIECFEEV